MVCGARLILGISAGRGPHATTGTGHGGVPAAFLDNELDLGGMVGALQHWGEFLTTCAPHAPVRGLVSINACLPRLRFADGIDQVSGRARLSYLQSEDLFKAASGGRDAAPVGALGAHSLS
jgi:hypothetical protein